MIVGEDLVLQEASDLLRFVGTIVDACGNRREDYPVFPAPATEFFDYVYSLGCQTRTFLAAFPYDFISTSVKEIALSKRQKLKTLRKAWERLHEYVKPALDADSLNLPMPLVEALEQMVRQVEDWKDFRFVLFHTSEANYLQVPAERIKDIADEIAREVGGDTFPDALGLVGIPYSQADTFFLNCLLPHEFAHFIYREAALSEISTKIDLAMERLDQELDVANDAVISYRRDTLASWIEETFCDLVALSLIGPAFTFAYSELTCASDLLGRADEEVMEFFEFSESYPSDAARFHVHQQFLVRLGWWEEIKERDAAPVHLLAKCETWSELSYGDYPILPEDTIPENRFVEVYRSLVPDLIDYVLENVTCATQWISSYSAQFPVIASYLERAIVPSTIIMDEGKVYPSPVVLINSGYCFKLGNMPDLFARIAGKSSDSVQDLSDMTERLELWVLKALEDYKLLTGQRTYVSHP